MKYVDIGRVKTKKKKRKNYTLHVMIDHSRLSDRMLQRLCLLKLKVVKIHQKAIVLKGYKYNFSEGAVMVTYVPTPRSV